MLPLNECERSSYVRANQHGTSLSQLPRVQTKPGQTAESEQECDET